MDHQDIPARSGQSRESEDIVFINEEKVPVEIRDIFRIKPSEFSAFKHSFEEWSKQWD